MREGREALRLDSSFSLTRRRVATTTSRLSKPFVLARGVQPKDRGWDRYRLSLSSPLPGLARARLSTLAKRALAWQAKRRLSRKARQKKGARPSVRGLVKRLASLATARLPLSRSRPRSSASVSRARKTTRRGVCELPARIDHPPAGRPSFSLLALFSSVGKRRSFSLDRDFYSGGGWFRGRPSLGGARVEIRSRRLVFLEGCARWDQQARLNGEPTRDEDMFSTRDEGRKSARVRPDSPKFEFFDSCSFKSCRLLRPRKSLTFPRWGRINDWDYYREEDDDDDDDGGRGSPLSFLSISLMAHRACSLTRSPSPSLARTLRSAGMAPASPTLPRAVATLRKNLARPILRTALPAKWRSKASSSSISSRRRKRSGKLTSLSTFPQRGDFPSSSQSKAFQGQTSWQMSHP